MMHNNYNPIQTSMHNQNINDNLLNQNYNQNMNQNNIHNINLNLSQGNQALDNPNQS